MGIGNRLGFSDSHLSCHDLRNQWPAVAWFFPLVVPRCRSCCRQLRHGRAEDIDNSGFQTFWLCLNNLNGMIGWDDYLYLFLCWVKATNQTKLKMKSADWCCFSVKTATVYDALWLYCFFGRCGHDVLKDSQMSLGRSPRTNMEACSMLGFDWKPCKFVPCVFAAHPLKTPHFLCAETFDRLCQYWNFRSSGSRSMFHSRHIHIQEKQYNINIQNAGPNKP